MKQMVYIHVPFCRHKCAYCDFVSGTNIGLKERYLSAVEKELEERGCHGEADTLYIGGGTPSMLNVNDIVRLKDMVTERFEINELQEWTVECNPEDMSEEWLSELHNAGVSRLSVGVQSLDDEELKWMERRHSGQEAIDAVRRAQKAGFSNISCDIIFGVPGNGLDETLKGILALGIQHISAYSLMMEEGSKITMKGTEGVDEERSAGMYKMIVEKLRSAGYIHYEISNWSLPGFESRHNSGYWSGRRYVGFGPGAHSYDGENERRWNIGNTMKYCSQVEKGERYWESEILTVEERFNEMIMLGLRRSEGVVINELISCFGEKRAEDFVKAMKKFEGLVNFSDGKIVLTESGVYVSDMIMSEGFILS